MVPAPSTGGPYGPGPTAGQEPRDEWSTVIDDARRAVDQADQMPDRAAASQAYLKARQLAIQAWASKVAPRASRDMGFRLGLKDTLASLADGFPPAVSRLLWRTFLGHAQAARAASVDEAAVDLPLRGGARSCPRDMAAGCAKHLAELAELLPGVITGERLSPGAALGNDDWALHELIKTFGDWKDGRMLVSLQVGQVDHERTTTVVRVVGKDWPNKGGSFCHEALVIRADGLLQIQQRCETWPPGHPLWSSTAVFRFESPPVALHAGDTVLAVVERRKAQSTGGNHPTFTFSSPTLVMVWGSYPGLRPHAGWRYLYGVDVEGPLDGAGLGT